MPRVRRVLDETGIHHVILRGNERKNTFLNYTTFLTGYSIINNGLGSDFLHFFSLDVERPLSWGRFFCALRQEFMRLARVMIIAQVYIRVVA